MRNSLQIAYVNYGNQSGVTAGVEREMKALGHSIARVDPTGVLALRNRRTRLPRPTPRVLYSVAASVLRFGRQAMYHRPNTVFAFDQHTRYAGRLLASLPRRPDVVLQNGALFAPGSPPPYPYVLLLDNTCRLAERQPPVPAAGIGKHIAFGDAWLARERATYRGAAGIATFSNLVRRSLIDDYGIDEEKIAVTGAGANLQPWPEPIRRDDGRTILFVGKDGFRRKGGPVLLRAFSKLREQRPGLRLVLAGPEEPLVLPEGVINLGLVSLERIGNLLAEATLFVLPTLREPYGIAYLDAMARGVPCIGSRLGVVPEIIGDAGVLVPPADEAALTVAMAALLDDPRRRHELGEAGRKRVLDGGLLWHDVAGRIAAMLGRCAGAGRRVAAGGVRP